MLNTGKVVYSDTEFFYALQTTFTINKAQHGDCILIRTFDRKGDEYNILIDGGPSKTYDISLRSAVSSLSTIHLLILTHIDSDHIGGLIKLLKSDVFKTKKVCRYWFNSKNLRNISVGTNISLTQAKTLEELLLEIGESPEKYADLVCVENGVYHLNDGIAATILSPDKNILQSLFAKWPDLHKGIFNKSETEQISSSGNGVRCPELSLKELAAVPFKADKSVEQDIFNSSSIAFILELFDCKLLLLGDARAEILTRSLRAMGYNTTDNRLKVDFVKVSHHGSKNNTSSELLDLIDCQNFIISTNGGSTRHKHPDRDVVARIVYHPSRDMTKPVKIFFNHSMPSIVRKKGPILLPEDINDGNWSVEDDVTQFSN